MRNIFEETKNKSSCTGCFACQQICPSEAIIMELDEKGFAYPFIDEFKCVNCDKCYSVCPQYIENPLENRKEPQPYAAWNKDNDVRSQSTSGGIFSVLASKIIESKGVVCGVSFTTDRKNTEHICAEDDIELSRLRRSKYLQSNINNCYKKVESYLQQNRTVLFSGTPCQVMGLNKYLDKEYENLYTIDLVCHGVPSKAFFDQYITFLEKKHESEIIEIKWRGNKYGWNDQMIEIFFKNESEMAIKCSEDPFYKGFLKSHFLRPSCYQCKYTSILRVGDITLGDFWKVGERYPQYDDNKGTSLVYLNSKKGKIIFDRVRENLIVGDCELHTTYDISNFPLSRPAKPPAFENEFWDDFFSMSFDIFLVKYYDK